MQDARESDAELGAAQVIVLTGTDARAFAQTQFAGDVRALQSGRWQWNAWLDPQGRVRALMQLADPGDGTLYAALRNGHAQTICEALQRYVLRAKVDLRTLADRHRTIAAAAPRFEAHCNGDAVIFGCGERAFAIGPQPGRRDTEAERAFRLAEIRAGWPALPTSLDETFLPPALGLERLGAVSFNKGCYPGQEIAARLHYLGGHKRRLARLGALHVLVPGQILAADQRSIGWILDAVPNAQGSEALAVIVEHDDNFINDLYNTIQVIERF